ncbi:hypothetical protein SB861_20700 [Paraburkholderia sp. SIMBA_049]
MLDVGDESAIRVLLNERREVMCVLDVLATLENGLETIFGRHRQRWIRRYPGGAQQRSAAPACDVAQREQLSIVQPAEQGFEESRAVPEFSTFLDE